MEDRTETLVRTVTTTAPCTVSQKTRHQTLVHIFAKY